MHQPIQITEVVQISVKEFAMNEAQRLGVTAGAIYNRLNRSHYAGLKVERGSSGRRKQIYIQTDIPTRQD